MQVLATCSPIRVMFRVTFVLATIIAVVGAALPVFPHLPGHPPDKVQHMAAFAVLTVLARYAWRGTNAWKIVGGLTLLGGAIEVMQMIPVLHRDASWADWGTDCATVLAVLTILSVLGAMRA